MRAPPGSRSTSHRGPMGEANMDICLPSSRLTHMAAGTFDGNRTMALTRAFVVLVAKSTHDRLSCIIRTSSAGGAGPTRDTGGGADRRSLKSFALKFNWRAIVLAAVSH